MQFSVVHFVYIHVLVDFFSFIDMNIGVNSHSLMHFMFVHPCRPEMIIEW